MKKYKIFGFLFLVLLLTVFTPTTNYKAFAENEKENEAKTTTTHKITTVKKIKKSKVKKTKKDKTTNTKKISTTKPTTTTKTPVTPTTTTTSSYSLATVATHNSATDCWTIIGGNVYNVTSWINQHPGGKQAIISLCGKDGTQAFDNQHGGQAKPATELKSFLIGKLQ